MKKNTLGIFILILGLFMSGCVGSGVDKVISDMTKGYNNTTTKAAEIPQYVNAEVGSVITFGKYEQDNNSKNGKEDIEWIVLEKAQDRILVISKYCLDSKWYSEHDDDVMWQRSVVRQWLNNDFFENAFSDKEKKMIPQTIVPTDKDNGFKENLEGNDTREKVYLLSVSEVDKYFPSSKSRMCSATDYAISQGAYLDDNHTINGRGACAWLLRSYGYNELDKSHPERIGIVTAEGRIDYTTYFWQYAVRPVIWININNQDELNGSSEISQTTSIENAEIGSNIIFGKYEQDNNTSNGKEDIEWIVLDKKDDKLFVTSKFSLDCMPYNDEDIDITWETCSLRRWLNNIFYYEAFNEDERNKIYTTTVVGDIDPFYERKKDAGNDTRDKVFLLSIKEAEKYFVSNERFSTSDEARMCAPTEYAIERGAEWGDKHKVYGVGTGPWWLRTPADISIDIVDESGNIGDQNHNANSRRCDYAKIAVRPAMWVSINQVLSEELRLNSSLEKGCWSEISCKRYDSGKLVYNFKYENDSKGRHIKQVFSQGEYEGYYVQYDYYDSVMSYPYNPIGGANAIKSVTAFSADGKSDLLSEYTYEYDSKSRVVKEIRNKGGTVSVDNYNYDGDICKVYSTQKNTGSNNENDTILSIIEYEDISRIKTWTTYKGDSETSGISRIQRYIYDSNGYLIRLLFEEIGGEPYKQEITYENDEHGNALIAKEKYANGGVTTFEYEYEYYPEGVPVNTKLVW